MANTNWPLPSDPELEIKLMEIARERGVGFETVLEEFVENIRQEYREGPMYVDSGLRPPHRD